MSNFVTEMNINIMITGPVSAGKSTLTNLLFVEQFSDMKIKRTTAVPQIYHEVEDLDKISDVKSILLQNRTTNTDIMKKTENPNYKLKLEDVKEIEYYVPKLFDFLNLRKDILLTIYDTPGLNDSRTKDVYYQYINNVFNKLNVIIFVLDINSAMNTSDENDILRMIITNIKDNKLKYNVDTKLVVLLNKCDDMSLNKHTNKYCLDEELLEMYEQANTIINATIKELYNGFKYDILPISCEDSYVYRMYKRNPNAKLDEKHLNKFGANEYGKSKWNVMSQEDKQSRVAELFKDFNYDDRITMTGFKQFKIVMQDILNDENQYKYLLDHIRLDLQTNIKNYLNIDISNELQLFQKYHTYLSLLIEKFEKPQSEFKFLYNAFDNFMMNYGIKFTEVFWSNIDSKTSIDTYQLVYKMYIIFRNQFIKNRKYIDDKIAFIKFKKNIYDKIDEIVKYINIYWIAKMDNSILTFNELTQIFDKLYENKYEILHELIIRKLSNVPFYTNIYANLYYTDNLALMLDTVEQNYNVPKNMITELAFTIITNIYAMLSTKDTLILNNLCSFWQNIVIKSSNKYYKKLLCFKNLFKVDIMNIDFYLKCDNVPCNYMSDYIIKRLKNEYPNEIATYDELIDQLYFKQNQYVVEPNIEVEVLNDKSFISRLDEVFLESKIINNVYDNTNIILDDVIE